MSSKTNHFDSKTCDKNTIMMPIALYKHMTLHLCTADQCVLVVTGYKQQRKATTGSAWITRSVGSHTNKSSLSF